MEFLISFIALFLIICIFGHLTVYKMKKSVYHCNNNINGGNNTTTNAGATDEASSKNIFKKMPYDEFSSYCWVIAPEKAVMALSWPMTDS